jgi:hypothetical protein
MLAVFSGCFALMTYAWAGAGAAGMTHIYFVFIGPTVVGVGSEAALLTSYWASGLECSKLDLEGGAFFAGDIAFYSGLCQFGAEADVGPSETSNGGANRGGGSG